MKILEDSTGKPEYFLLTPEEYQIFNDVLAEQMTPVNSCGYDPFAGFTIDHRPLPYWHVTFPDAATKTNS